MKRVEILVTCHIITYSGSCSLFWAVYVIGRYRNVVVFWCCGGTFGCSTSPPELQCTSSDDQEATWPEG